MSKAALAVTAVVLFGSIAAVAAGGSWMKQVSGIGRSWDKQTASKYALQNLRQELDDLVALCHQHRGRPQEQSSGETMCRQYPTNWQCTAAGRVTCYF